MRTEIFQDLIRTELLARAPQHAGNLAWPLLASRCLAMSYDLSPTCFLNEAMRPIPVSVVWQMSGEFVLWVAGHGAAPDKKPTWVVMKTP